jgi:hypothetical protein
MRILVKTSELPGEDKHPNKSTIVIYDDKIKVYLFSDGFNGLNAQVGNMDLSNIFIDDRRESYRLPKPLGISNNRTIFDYRNFFRGMIDEYNRHYPKHPLGEGHSYIDCNRIEMYRLLRESVDIDKASFDKLMKNPSHLFDIANFAMFLYTIIIDRGYVE